jgi:hypothetical protein
MTTETTPVGAGESSPAHDGSAIDRKAVTRIVWDRVAKERPHVICGDLLAITEYVIDAVESTQNAPAEARASRRLGPDVRQEVAP